MSDNNESQIGAWHEDIDYLVTILKESFESSDARYSVDEQNDILYVELEGLQDYDEGEIIEIAEPLLDAIDLDFDDIILLPLEL